jgi:hypothetical protein
VERADPRRAGAMSSPARSTISAAEDVADSIDALYRKDEAMAGDTPLYLSLPFASGARWMPQRVRVTDRLVGLAELKSEVMEALQREVRSLDEDNWMFAAPRSRINLVSRPGKKGNTKIATDGFLISFF